MAETKERILDATAALFQRYGYTGTGLKQIVANANAPFGSIYHFFPGGKTELGEAVIRRSGQMYLELVLGVFEAAGDPVQGVRDIFDGAAAVLQATDYVDACPVATVALEVASSNEPLRQATAEVFETWIATAASSFGGGLLDERAARHLAMVVIELLEGGFVLSRAARSTEALDAAGDAAVIVVAAALNGASRPRRPRRLRRAPPPP